MGILEYNISFLPFLSLLHERIIIWYIRSIFCLAAFSHSFLERLHIHGVSFWESFLPT